MSDLPMDDIPIALHEQILTDLSRRLIEERAAKQRIVDTHNQLADTWMRERDEAIARAQKAEERLAYADVDNDRLRQSLKEENDDLLEKLRLTQELAVDRLDAIGQRASLRARVAELATELAQVEEERDRLRELIDQAAIDEGKLRTAVKLAGDSAERRGDKLVEVIARAEAAETRVQELDRLLGFVRQERDKAEGQLKAVRNFVLAHQE